MATLRGGGSLELAGVFQLERHLGETNVGTNYGGDGLQLVLILTRPRFRTPRRSVDWRSGGTRRATWVSSAERVTTEATAARRAKSSGRVGSIKGGEHGKRG